jgi:DNA-binding NarL/FixJ family response regulator
MQTAITRTSGPGRVLLVDDHPAVRRVLRSLLEEVGGWQVVGEADSGEAAIPLVEQLTPDVVLMDCRMPGAGGVAATREIVNRWPEVAVVAHTAYADETYVREMVAAGARGYVLKGDVPAAVLEALSAARQGQARLSAAVTGPVMEDLRELYEAAVNRSKELEAQNADLSSTVARLEEVDRLKDEFLAMVSHELRTPITVVLGMAQTLVGRPDMAATADGQEILQRVVRQGKRLRDMVEQLLQASAFVANRSPVLRAEEVMAAEVVAEVVDDWRLAEPDRRVEFLLPTQPRSLQGDAEALRMVVGNLVDNAGKHAPPGTPIRVLVSQPPGLTRIEVADQGDGWRRSTASASSPPSPSSTPPRPGGSAGSASACSWSTGWSGAWGAGSGSRTTRAAAPASWSSCPTWPRYRVAPAPGTSRPPEASKGHEAHEAPASPDRPAAGRAAGGRLRRARRQ